MQAVKRDLSEHVAEEVPSNFELATGHHTYSRGGYNFLHYPDALEAFLLQPPYLAL